MAEAPLSESVARIERALQRIEAAAAARAFDNEQLARRNRVLRTRIEEAIASLDSLIAQELPDAPSNSGQEKD